MVQLKDKNVVIIGGGKIALRKITGLKDTGAKVKVISPEILPEIKAFDFIECVQKQFETEDVKGAQFVFAATDSKVINMKVVQACDSTQFVNDVSESEHSTFINPAVMEQGDLLIAVSTQGTSPLLSKEIKAELEGKYNDTYIEKLKTYKQRRMKTYERDT